MTLTATQIYNLVYAFSTVLLAVFFIFLIKKSYKLPTGSIGPELNLLTYGYLIDIGLAAIKSEPYWEHIPNFLVPIKGLLVLFIGIINLGLLVHNFKLANLIETGGLTNSKKKCTKRVSIFWGVLSVFIFLTFKMF